MPRATMLASLLQELTKTFVVSATKKHKSQSLSSPCNATTAYTPSIISIVYTVYEDTLKSMKVSGS